MANERIRTVLKVELVVYRVEEVEDEHGEWSEMDTDCTYEEVLDEAVVLEGRIVSQPAVFEGHDGVERCVWDEQTPDQLSREDRVLALGDEVVKQHLNRAILRVEGRNAG